MEAESSFYRLFLLCKEQFSFRCNINRTYMGEVERGEKSPSLLVIAKIAKALDISKSELMNYE